MVTKKSSVFNDIEDSIKRDKDRRANFKKNLDNEIKEMWKAYDKADTFDESWSKPLHEADAKAAHILNQLVEIDQDKAFNLYHTIKEEVHTSRLDYMYNPQSGHGHFVARVP